VKKLFIALLGLIVLLVVAILVGPSFIDWNTQKGRITAEVERLTGRKLTIDGDLSLTILPAPAFSAARVRFANIDGGSAPSMIELESLDVRVALIPLIQGQVEVERIDLVRPTILLEVLPDGRGNWEISATDPAMTAPSSTPGPSGRRDGFFSDVRLQSLRISDGTLIYRDAAAGREIGVLVYNAASAPIGNFLELPQQHLLQVVDVNIRAPIVFVHTLVPPMLERRRGAVVLMSSLSGLQGSPRIATYAASKAFNTILAEGLWGELRQNGIDVLASCAGAIRTRNYAELCGIL